MRFLSVLFCLYILTFSTIPSHSRRVSKSDVSKVKFVENPKIQKYLDNLLLELIDNDYIPFFAPYYHSARSFEIQVIDKKEKFAQCFKDGRIHITRGLLEDLSSEAELVALISRGLNHIIFGSHGKLHERAPLPENPKDTPKRPCFRNVRRGMSLVRNAASIGMGIANMATLGAASPATSLATSLVSQATSTVQQGVDTVVSQSEESYNAKMASRALGQKRYNTTTTYTDGHTLTFLYLHGWNPHFLIKLLENPDAAEYIAFKMDAPELEKRIEMLTEQLSEVSEKEGWDLNNLKVSSREYNDFKYELSGMSGRRLEVAIQEQREPPEETDQTPEDSSVEQESSAPL